MTAKNSTPPSKPTTKPAARKGAATASPQPTTLISAGPFNIPVSKNEAAKINSIATAHGITPGSVVKLALKELHERFAQKAPPKRRELTAAESMRKRRDDEFQTNRDARLLAGWVIDCRDLARQVIGGEANGWAVALYFVRLCGLLGEVRTYWQKRLGLPDAYELDILDIRGFVTQLVAALEGMQALLSEDQLIWIEYRRHFEAHAVQHKYRLHVDSTSGALVTTLAPKLIPGAEPRELSAHEDAMDRLVQGHTESGDAPVARDISTALIVKLEEAGTLAQQIRARIPRLERNGRP